MVLNCTVMLISFSLIMYTKSSASFKCSHHTAQKDPVALFPTSWSQKQTPLWVKNPKMEAPEFLRFQTKNLRLVSKFN